MDKRELLDRYEATGDEEAFALAKPRYEQALNADPGNATLRRDYGYLLECHGRYTLRRAVAEYERAVAADPDQDKARYQLIAARAAAYGGYDSVVEHRRRLAASPDDVREHRFLAAAYLADHDYRRASEVVDAGLRLAPRDRRLIELRGDARAGLGDSQGALADWRLAVELDDADISPLYSTAFLLERLDRTAEAVAVWRTIEAWSRSRGNIADTHWPLRKIHRLEGLLDADRSGAADPEEDA
jgi:Tfp pilus assembly protein PilF